MHVVFKKSRKFVFRLKHRFGLSLRILLNTRLFVHSIIFQCILVGLVYVQTKEDAKKSWYVNDIQERTNCSLGNNFICNCSPGSICINRHQGTHKTDFAACGESSTTTPHSSLQWNMLPSTPATYTFATSTFGAHLITWNTRLSSISCIDWVPPPLRETHPHPLHSFMYLDQHALWGGWPHTHRERHSAGRHLVTHSLYGVLYTSPKMARNRQPRLRPRPQRLKVHTRYSRWAQFCG